MASSKRILYIGDIDNKFQRENYGIIDCLQQKGISVDIITIKHPKMEENCLKEKDYCKNQALVIYENLRFKDYNLIFTLFFGLDLLIGIYLKQLLNIKLITVAMASQVYRRSESDIRKKVEKTDCIIASTKLIAEYLKKLDGSQEKVKQIYLGIDTRRFHPISSTKLFFGILFCRFIEKKGIFTYLEIVKIYLNIDPTKKFVLIGSGKLEPEILKFKSENSLDNLIILGFQEYEAMPGIINSSQYAIFSSRKIPLNKPKHEFFQNDMEGIPFSIMEVLACGIPVITTNTGAIPEIITNNVTGIIADENNIDSFIDAINLLESNNELKNNIIENGYRLVKKKFEMNKQIKKIMDYLV